MARLLCNVYFYSLPNLLYNYYWPESHLETSDLCHIRNVGPWWPSHEQLWGLITGYHLRVGLTSTSGNAGGGGCP